MCSKLFGFINDWVFFVNLYLYSFQEFWLTERLLKKVNAMLHFDYFALADYVIFLQY